MNAASESRLSLAEIAIRCVAVGFAYALASALVAIVLGPMSRLAPSIDNLLVWFISGTVISLALAPFILHSGWPPRNTVLAVWAVLACVRSLGLGIEGSLFKPAQASSAVIGAFMGTLVALLVAWLSVVLLLPSASPSTYAANPRRRPWGWLWRVLLVGVAYFVFYFVFGATNALLYTRSFYENNPQYGLSLPPTGLIFLAQVLRGPLFAIGSLFILRAVDAPRGKLAAWLGILLFVVGGLAPYLEITFRTMPPGFNLATLTEIFLQNFLTGIVAVNLYKPRTS